MRIGLATIKPYKKLDKQYIGTQFVIIGIPLFPVNSYFIIDDLLQRSIEIGIYWKHVLKIYTILIAFILSVLILIPGLFDWGNITKTIILIAIIALTLLILLRYDRMTEEDKKMRLLLGKITGINALPEYMEINTARTIKNKLIISLKQKLNTKENWGEIINNKDYNHIEIPLKLAIAKYEFRINPTKKNKKLIIGFLNDYK